MNDLIPRPMRPAEWPMLQRLLQETHERETAEAYCEEYPLMLSPEQAENLIVIPATDEKRILCHVGTLPRTLTIGQGSIKAALIGSVATHPSARGKGLASKALFAAHSALIRRGISIVFLWSEPRSLYTKAGYHPVGRSFLFRVPGGEQKIDPSLRCRPATAKDHAAIWELLSRRESSLKRSSGEHSVLQGIPGVEAYVAMRSNRLVAVVYMGKGTDLRDIGHDWAGESEDIVQLLLWIQRQGERTLGLLTPDLPNDTAAEALARGWPFAELPVAQACIIDPLELEKEVVTLLQPADRGVFAPQPEREGAGDRGDSPLVQRLFGPARSRKGSGLPFPFFIWGLDSM